MSQAETEGVTLMHIAETYHGYPGESVTLATRLRVTQNNLTGLTVCLYLSPGLIPHRAADPPQNFGPGKIVLLKQDDQPGGAAQNSDSETAQARPTQKIHRKFGTEFHQVTWSQKDSESLEPGRAYEFEVQVRIPPLPKPKPENGADQEQFGKPAKQDQFISCVQVKVNKYAMDHETTEVSHTSGVYAKSETDPAKRDSDVWSNLVRLDVSPQPRCLTYLPSLYQQPDQELLWRYLMIFDRVWGKFEELLRNQAAYFDPHLSPAKFKSWLAQWVGCPNYSHLPQEIWLHALPDLMPQLVQIHRRRGTAAGLAAYLQFWLNVTAKSEPVYNLQIKDAVLSHFTLGEQAQMGRHLILDSAAHAALAERIQVEEAVVGRFTLGEQAQVGRHLILGSAAHAAGHFSVTIRWPPDSEPLNDAFIRELIDEWKPVHTTYDVNPKGGLS